MFLTTGEMERTAVMPTAAPMGAVSLGLGYGAASSTIPPAHRALAPSANNAMKPWAFGIGRQVGLTTNRSTRHLGRRPST
jgi:hypothetical protein